MLELGYATELGDAQVDHSGSEMGEANPIAAGLVTSRRYGEEVFGPPKHQSDPGSNLGRRSALLVSGSAGSEIGNFAVCVGLRRGGQVKMTQANSIRKVGPTCRYGATNFGVLKTEGAWDVQRPGRSKNLPRLQFRRHASCGKA